MSFSKIKIETSLKISTNKTDINKKDKNIKYINFNK